MHETPGNPVIPVYAADPDAHLIGDRYYIYATNAGFYPSKDSFTTGQSPETGHGFSAWSSPDLRTWQSEGPILRFADIEWARDLPHAWAPCLAERNGKYYFYFCADSRIGVAVSDSPTGPFVDAKGEPLVDYRDDLSAIDPMVFVDDDGQAYLYWGAVPGFWLEGQVEYVRMHLSVQKLAPDMVTLVGEEMPTIFTRRLRESWHDLDHIEATHIVKRGGTYYLQWSAGSFSSPDLERSYRVNYATAMTPLGPWHLASEEPMITPRPDLKVVGPGHHGIIGIPGTDEWWCVYHAHPGDADRRVYIDRLRFDESGRIAPVVPTLEGPPARPVSLGLRLERTGPFPQGEPIGFRVLASEPFSRIEFYAGDEKVGEGSGPTWTWENPASGFHKIRARAEDASGRLIASADLNLDVL
ncbi:MAG: family 43 glycosylhydrolase [Fimbriimonas sp.]